MKKIFAALAASTIAVSMLAFTGCGGSKSEQGAIPGNYENKTDQEIADIIDNIDPDKIFGGNENSQAPAVVNMGVKVNLSGGFTMGEMMSANGSVNLDYKMNASADGAAGTGSMAVKANYMSTMSGVKQEQSIDFSGSAYNDTEWVYAVSGEDKAKINMEKLMEAFGGSSTIKPTSYLAAEEPSTVASLLAMAKVLSINVAIDDSDGVKIKLSATEETIWATLSMASEEIEISAAQITAIKSMVTFNTFKFDVYFALDKDGAFAGASVVMDIDAMFDSSIFSSFIPGSPSPTAEAAAEMPVITAKVKGSVEIYTHNDSVKVPDTVKSGEYADMTDTVIAMIKNMM